MKIAAASLAMISAAGLMTAFGQTPAGPPFDPAVRAAEFEKADKNKDGQLTKEEWLAVLPASINKDRAAAMWSRMDPDNTGHIGKDAFVNFRGPPRGSGTSGATAPPAPPN